MQRCGDADEDSLCILPDGKHGHHTDGDRWWPNPEVLAEQANKPKKIEERRGRAKSAASAESRAVLRDIRADMTGRHIDPEGWREHVLKVLASFLEDHDGDFTTPEDIWPLIEEPDVDRRNMQKVVQTALRSGLIARTGRTKFLGDTYYTADGHPFEMNKYVPIYRKAGA